MPGFEARMRAHVILRRVNILACGNLLHHICRTVTIAKISNFDNGAVICPERISRVEFSKARRKDRLPIRTNIHDFAGKCRTGDLSANDGYNSARTTLSLPDFDYGIEFNGQIGNMAQGWLGKHTHSPRILKFQRLGSDSLALADTGQKDHSSTRFFLLPDKGPLARCARPDRMVSNKGFKERCPIR